MPKPVTQRIRRLGKAFVRYCEGLRTPAGREVAGSAEGRRPKASREGTRGAGREFGVYGDLVIADGRGSHWAGLIEVLGRLVDREIGRARGSLRPRVCTLANVAISTLQVEDRPEEDVIDLSPAARTAAGSRCEEVVGVMRPRS